MSDNTQGFATFEQKKKDLKDRYQAMLAAQAWGEDGAAPQLGKDTSNLFRHRDDQKKCLDVRHFTKPISIDTDNHTVTVEGMITFSDLTDYTLPFGFMPAVVPELKSITVGGAYVGVGIESSSFKYGLVHEAIIEAEVLLPDGTTVIATADNEYSDLFFALPNSYGTLGYAIRLVMKVIPVKPYVKMAYEHFDNPKDYYNRFKALCLAENGDDFLDGVIFSKKQLTICRGNLTDSAPYTSNYKYLNIFYKSIEKRDEDYLRIYDYIWRWDTDWFWCSKVFFLQNKLLRFLTGKWTLNSIFYWKIKKLSNSHWFFKWLSGLRTVPSESVIQDVTIPIDHAEQFLEFFFNDIPIFPIWNCPTKPAHTDYNYPIFAQKPDQLYMNFGFWDMIPSNHEPGYFNRKVENKVDELGGNKSLYSTMYYDRDTFNRIYNDSHYQIIKKKYDPNGIFKQLYEKCAEK
jgi:FAD/FMN-containing dehydrogenase